MLLPEFKLKKALIATALFSAFMLVVIRDTTTKGTAVTPATNIHATNTVFENVWDETAGIFLS